jgi:hypothetical protein
MSSARPIRVTAIRGRIRLGSYGVGSKSERDTTFIETVDASYILRRKTGPVFDDTMLTRYIGHEVECDGFLVGRTLLAERINTID